MLTTIKTILKQKLQIESCYIQARSNFCKEFEQDLLFSITLFLAETVASQLQSLAFHFKEIK